MVITHHGGQSFKVTLGDLAVAFDPASKNSPVGATRFGADLVFVSLDHPDMNGIAEVTYGGKTPFVIAGPGEYERRGVVARGFPSKSAYPAGKTKEERLTTSYVVELEDMTLVHLGALERKELSPALREAIDDVDVLFVPIGGGGVLSAGEAYELAVSLEPRIIIPMHWSGIGAKDALAHFLKEAGTAGEKADKLTLKKKDLAERNGSILILTP